MSRKVQKMYTENKCIGALECIKICPEGALELTTAGIVTDVKKCTLCGDCADVCPTKAIEMSGEEMSLDGIMAIIRKETLLMDQSKGGVTFSGGEPLHHHRFLMDLLEACGREGIHRCVDTTGFANEKVLMDVAEKADLFLYDLKMMDSVKHKKYTGVPNEKILNNLIALSATGAEIIIRIPLIAGVNDDIKNLQQSAAFIASLPKSVQRVQILPFHHAASKKYEKLGEIYKSGDMKEPSKEVLDYCIALFKGYGIGVEIGG
jgi:pyruvate formate lyase activating enzyme